MARPQRSRRREGGGATWFQGARWRYRVTTDPDDGPGKWLYADTLTDCRTEFTQLDETPVRFEIQRRTQPGDGFEAYGTLVEGGGRARLVRDVR